VYPNVTGNRLRTSVLSQKSRAVTVLKTCLSLEDEVMKLFGIFSVLLVLTTLALGEDKPPMKFVRVVGTSDVQVEPDEAVIEVGVAKQGASARAAKEAEASAARRILADLRDKGVAEKDVQTTYLSLELRSKSTKGVRVSYFSAEQTLTITVRDLARLDALLESLVRAGGNQIDSLRYQTSQPRKYRDQARELAVKAAREKAQALAQALGQGIGKAQSIDEVPASANTGAFLANSVASYGDGKKEWGFSTAAGQISISASVVVTFELN
jgi:uncharacterized protein YggE